MTTCIDPIATSRTRSTSDEELLRRYRDGDQGAFASLYRRYQGIVMRQLRRYLRPCEAEEAAQDIFAKVAAHRWMDRGTPFEHWLSRVTRNTAISYRRKDQTRVRGLEALSTHPSREPEVPPDAILRGTITESLRQLDPARREAVVLRLVHQLSYREIAELQGAAEACIAQRICQARRRLKRSLKQARRECA